MFPAWVTPWGPPVEVLSGDVALGACAAPGWHIWAPSRLLPHGHVALHPACPPVLPPSLRSAGQPAIPPALHQQLFAPRPSGLPAEAVPGLDFPALTPRGDIHDSTRHPGAAGGCRASSTGAQSKPGQGSPRSLRPQRSSTEGCRLLQGACRAVHPHPGAELRVLRTCARSPPACSVPAVSARHPLLAPASFWLPHVCSRSAARARCL